MLALRKLWTVLVGAWAAAFAARAVLNWILGLDDTWVAAAILVAALLGAWASLGAARDLGRASGTGPARAPAAARPPRDRLPL
jgi:hypothetical protein